MPEERTIPRGVGRLRRCVHRLLLGGLLRADLVSWTATSQGPETRGPTTHFGIWPGQGNNESVRWLAGQIAR
jgi:hypothetical protein